MKTWEYLKARTIIEQEQITLLAYDPDQSRPLFIFRIKEKITVIYNHKGWICDYVENGFYYDAKVLQAKQNGKEAPEPWTCAYNRGKVCIHVIAAQLLIVKMGLCQEWMSGKDFSFVELTRSYSEPTHPLNHNGEQNGTK
jgi:hypothetical protein